MRILLLIVSLCIGSLSFAQNRMQFELSLTGGVSSSTVKEYEYYMGDQYYGNLPLGKAELTFYNDPKVTNRLSLTYSKGELMCPDPFSDMRYILPSHFLIDYFLHVEMCELQYKRVYDVFQKNSISISAGGAVNLGYQYTTTQFYEKGNVLSQYQNFNSYFFTSQMTYKASKSLSLITNIYLPLITISSLDSEIIRSKKENKVSEFTIYGPNYIDLRCDLGLAYSLNKQVKFIANYKLRYQNHDLVHNIELKETSHMFTIGIQVQLS
ncbi:hypothetical protein OAT16_06765 [Prolixibacteraceae bacterium]|nr:hypothetical protein [Prolixibacteraceae bacterium]